jgi:CRISPR-associated endonuclease Csn1
MNEEPVVWAFDLGKGSIGEAVRQGTNFLHKASLLIPPDFAETKTAATRRRMWRTRQAHKAREHWLTEVLRAAGIEVLHGRNYDKAGNWKPGERADERLEREFAKSGDSTCYTSCLLRIKLLRGDKLEPWQIYKALHSAIQRRGYDPAVPWRSRERRKTKSGDAADDEATTQKRMAQFERDLETMAPGKSEYHFPCYFDAWKMGLWNPAKPDELQDRIGCRAESTRNQIIPRKLVEEEIRLLVDAAAKQYPKLKKKAGYILYGPTETAYASFDAKLRKKHHLKVGGMDDWQGVLGQKIPRFDNRIIGRCVLIPRLNVCKIRTDENGKLHQQSRIAADTVFLMRLKNMRFQTAKGQACLTAKQIAEIFNDPKRSKLGMKETQWKKYCLCFGAKPMLGQFQEVEERRFSGRSRFCRPALEILKRLILSGDTPSQAYEKEIARLNGNLNPMHGLVEDDLKFLVQMGNTWEGLYIPNQKLDALARSTHDPQEAISQLIGSQNDPIVRHRLTLFAKRLDFLSVTMKLGAPDFVVLEFVREDFMGKKAKFEYFKFQRDRAHDRAKAREDAATAGATERSAGSKMELLKAQVGECLYTNAQLIPEKLDEYVIDHIVPRAKGGPDAAVNYSLTTRGANDDKGDRTPYEWLSGKQGWDAYVERVKRRIGTLRNKKVQLLTSPDAERLVEKYTALAETAWISKLAQTIVGLRFGWVNGNDSLGHKRVIVVSGGLTGRIRRKYKLNSLLNPDAKSEEDAETKNRNDDRHHALDAMVISFIPNWARNPKSTGFFRFPEGVHRELFGKEIESVKPRNVAIGKPIFEETIYGQRSIDGHKFIVGREILSGLAIKIVQNRETLKKHADIDTHRIVDSRIRRDVEAFWEANPTASLATWRQWCSNYRLGLNGPHVERILVTKSKADSAGEYKNIAKEGAAPGKGQFKRGARHRGYFIYDRPAPTLKEPRKMQVEVWPVFVFESRRAVQEKLARNAEWKIYGFFESGCQVRTTREWIFRGKKYPPDEYILGSVWANRNAKLWHPIHKEVGPVGLRSLLDAGFEKI